MADVTLTDDERRLLKDFAITGFQLLSRQAPEIVTDLIRKKLLEWEWNGGIPVYHLTDAGHAAIARRIPQSAAAEKE